MIEEGRMKLMVERVHWVPLWGCSVGIRVEKKSGVGRAQ